MAGAELFQGPHKAVASGTTVTITVSSAAELFVAFESGGSRSGGFAATLPTAGWTDTGTETTGGVTMQLWSKVVEAGSTNLPATTTSQTVMSISVKAGASGFTNLNPKA